MNQEQLKTYVAQLWQSAGQLAVEIAQTKETLASLEEQRLANLGAIDFAIQLLKEEEQAARPESEQE